MSPRFLPRCRPALSALLSLVLLAGCGGAGEMGSGGTGAAASTAEGTVTGFGSIFVDGVRFDDSAAAVTTDAPDGSTPPAEAKFGQRVEVGFEAEGVAKTVKVAPEILGVVEVVSTQSNRFTVLGQTVLVNTNPAAGPVTQFEGTTGLADMRPGDPIEVHGVASIGPGLGFLQATRVEKRASLDHLRVGGIVRALVVNGAARSFTLGGLTVDASSATLVPGSRPLQVGQPVVVFAAPGALNGSTLTASRVRIRERGVGLLADYLGGVISNLTATADGSTFVVGNVLVTRNAATATEPPNAVLANGQYVRLRGAFTTDDAFAATEIKVRSGGNVLDADLRGIALGVVAATQTFTVRGVAVDASAATIDCGAAGLASGQYVEVEGRIRLGGVDATSVKCVPAPAGAVIELRGTASAVDGEGNSLTLTTTAGAQTVRWTVLTFFADPLRRALPGQMNGRPLRVEGVLVNGVFVATKIRLDN